MYSHMHDHILLCFRYITYSKEDEAIRCIQNVHGFVLDGRSLKYVHNFIWEFILSIMGSIYILIILAISGHALGPQSIVMHG